VSTTSKRPRQLRPPSTAAEQAKAAYAQALVASSAAEERLFAAIRGSETWPLYQAVDSAKSNEQTALIDHIAAALVARFPALGEARV
jgi:hypothetical protein